MYPEINSHEELKKLLVENQRLLIENNQMLHKMRRAAAAGSWISVISFVILITIPLIIYLTYVKPSIEQVREQLTTFEQVRYEASNYADWYQPSSTPE